MKRFWMIAALIAGTIALSSCASKKKADEGTDLGDGDSVTQKAANFDSSGSDSGNIDGLFSINFDYDRANLNSSTKSMMKKNAEWLKSNSNVTVTVEGHCDRRGSSEYNLALGDRRARAVKNYLVSLGVSRDRVETVSYGKEKLLALGDSESDHSQNRRANFVPR